MHGSAAAGALGCGAMSVISPGTGVAVACCAGSVMANSNRSEQDRDEYVKGGRGRKDEVGRSGIYPASSPDAPADAEVRSPGNLVGHTEVRRKVTDDQDVKKADQSSGSE